MKGADFFSFSNFHSFDIFSQDLLYPLFLQSVDNVGDLYIDVADAYTENGWYGIHKAWIVRRLYHLLDTDLHLFKHAKMHYKRRGTLGTYK